MPKKVEIPVAPSPKSNPPPFIIIGSMEVPITNHVGPIVIEGLAPAATQEESPSVVAEIEKEKRPSVILNIYNQSGVLRG